MEALITLSQIDLYRLCTLRSGLKMEIRGLRMSSGKSCYAILKAEGYKGSKEKILAQVIQEIEHQKTLQLTDALIAQGMSRSDAQAVAEAEQLTA